MARFAEDAGSVPGKAGGADAGSVVMKPGIEAEIEAPAVIELPESGETVEIDVQLLLDNTGEEAYVAYLGVSEKAVHFHVLDPSSREVRVKEGGGLVDLVNRMPSPYELEVPAGLGVHGTGKLTLDASDLKPGERYTIRGEMLGQVAEHEFTAVAPGSSRELMVGVPEEASEAEASMAETGLASSGLASSALAPSGLIGEIARRLMERLRELEVSYSHEGRSLEEIGSAEELVERMTAIVPQPTVWDETLGPFYTTAGVAKLLGGISRQAVSERRARRTIVALKTSDGAWVYPAFQFNRQNAVIDHLPEVLEVFESSGADDWTVGAWLVSGLRTLNGRSVVEWLESGGDPEIAVAVARDAARRFAQ